MVIVHTIVIWIVSSHCCCCCGCFCCCVAAVPIATAATAAAAAAAVAVAAGAVVRVVLDCWLWIVVAPVVVVRPLDFFVFARKQDFFKELATGPQTLKNVELVFVEMCRKQI